MLYLVIRYNSFTFTFTDCPSKAGYIVRDPSVNNNRYRFGNASCELICEEVFILSSMGTNLQMTGT